VTVSGSSVTIADGGALQILGGSTFTVTVQPATRRANRRLQGAFVGQVCILTLSIQESIDR
jgi:hypothetical protein